MPRTRQLKHDFFLNENLAALDPMARLLFAGLWLLADREGRLEDRPARIKAQLFPYHDADVSGLLGVLSAFVVRYQVNGERYLQVKNFKKHQHIHPDEKASLMPPPPHNSEIPGDLKTGSEITPVVLCPLSVSSSPSFSPSPKQPGQAPIDLKNLGGILKDADDLAGDYSDYRLPKNFGGHYGGAYIVNVPGDECRFLLEKWKPGPKVRAALEWQISRKKLECAK